MTAPTHRQIVTVLAGLMLGMFLAALDQTVVGTAMRTIADDLHGLDRQAWATTAYLVGSTVTMPLYGKLGDLYGRRRLYLAAIAVFVAGSLLCAVAPSMYALAAARAVQGVGAGGLMSLPFAILADLVSPRERARYQGYVLAVFGVSSVAGPLIGGVLAGHEQLLGADGWRWIFLVNVPVGVAALIVVTRLLPQGPRRRDTRVDWLGALLLTVAVVPVLVVADQGRSWGWVSGPAVAAYVLAVAALAGWVVVERRRGDDALLPIRLFGSAAFSVATATTVLLGAALFGVMALTPLYLQIVQGASPARAGLMMLPVMGGLILASVATGRLIVRTGRYKRCIVAGLVLITAAALLFHLIVDAATPLAITMTIMGVAGLGLGSAMQPLTLATQAAAPPRDMGVATASATFFRQLGGTLGVAVALSVLFGTVGERIDTALASVGRAAGGERSAAARDLVRDGGERVLQDSSVLQHVDPRVAAPFREGFATSIQLVFLVLAVAAAIGCVIALAMRELPLSSMSGEQARRAEAEPARTS